MVRVMIQVSRPVKAKLDALRKQGTTASGYIRACWSGSSHTRQRKDGDPCGTNDILDLCVMSRTVSGTPSARMKPAGKPRAFLVRFTFARVGRACPTPSLRVA